MRNVITSENFHDIKRLMEETRNRAKNSKDPFHTYSYEQFCIVGEDVFERFCKENGVEPKASWWWSAQQELKNKSTIAEVKMAYYIEYHYEAKDDSSSWDRASKFLCVAVDGDILRASFYKSNTASFELIDDNRNYHTHLPYKWEEQNRTPNKISEITNRKIMSWVEWLRRRRDIFDKTLSEKNDRVAEFLLTVRKAASQCSESRISEDSGFIVANNIRYSYKITDGSIHQELKLDRMYHDDFLKAFMLMKDGKFVK